MIKLNSIPLSVFEVKANETADNSERRAQFISAGRLLTWEHAKKAQKANASEMVLDATGYKKLNEEFMKDHLLYAAQRACAFTGEKAPSDFAEFKAMGQKFYGDALFYKVLQGIYTEIITPILPAVYSNAVDVFADVVEVGFAETAQITVGSNDIPIFQDSAWGTQRSIPRNRFYEKDITLNPTPRAAYISMKWHQMVGNGTDFGAFFANITAGVYAKTVGLWNAGMTAAASDTTLIPSNLSITYSSPNWVALANKIAALSNTSITNVIGYGGAVALSKLLPNTVTGAANVNMDAAIATLLGADYVRTGFLGENMGVRLMALTDAVIPGTQNTTVQTILPSDKVWMLAGNGRKPMTIAYNRETPITLDIDPSKAGDFEVGMILTIAMDSVSVFSSKVGLVTIS